MRERHAMMLDFAPKCIKNHWLPIYEKMADDYLERLPTDYVLDVFPTFAGPIAAKMLGEMNGISNASDQELQRWPQALTDRAGNFGYFDKLSHAQSKQMLIQMLAFEGMKSASTQLQIPLHYRS